VFDNNSRAGFVTGSVNHDIWKTGIKAQYGKTGFNGFRVFGGIADSNTRDALPHGMVKGQQVDSPKMLLEFVNDWRDGMESYGKICAVAAPALKWEGGTPIGWNSWSAAADKINYQIYMNALDVMTGALDEPGSFGPGTVVYLNLDSFGGNLNDAQQRAAIKKIKAKGARAGTYEGWWCYWGGGLDGDADGTNHMYKWRDLVLKGPDGNPVPKIDGAYCLDPTHPGTIMRMEQSIQHDLDMGFQYIKIDFLSHGAVEGEHFLEGYTGIQAYNYGMQKMLDYLGTKTDKDFFISLSIAPIFPSQYGHTRRISCDTFGALGDPTGSSAATTEYMLNSLTYGWWLGKTVYSYNDPDSILLYPTPFQKADLSYNDGLSRYLSSIISGGIMLDSDNFMPKDDGSQDALNRAKKIFGYTEVNAVGAKHLPFRPVEGNTGRKAADEFTMTDSSGTYLAVFNFDEKKAKDMTIDLSRLGLDAAKTYSAYDMFAKTTSKVTGKLQIHLEGAEPKIFRIN
jgi:hypothetical protein